MNQDQLAQIDNLVFSDDPIVVDSELQDTITSYIGEIRSGVFELARAAGIDPFDVPNWDSTMGSPAEVPGFIKKLAQHLRMN